ncbi:MAG: pyridoxal phosphate-dependent aminotransferase [Tissierellia bacterium]|nr:pyridoxal phosphate-dependent aminotransferase [Tissierellia bacterium]
MTLSKRIQAMPYSAIRKLTPYANAAKKAGKKIYHLNIGAPDVKTPQVFFEAIKEADIDVLSYAPSPGLPELLEATSNYYKGIGLDFEPQEIVVTNGASEALFFVLFTLLDPGDEILTCEPYYANYFSYFTQAGVSLKTFPTSVENNFHLPSREVIEEKISPKTKCILLSNPGNPTGAVYTQEEIHMVCQLAKDHDLYIIADEVYREFIFDGAEFVSFASVKEVQDRVVVLDSISKRFSACGARIGSVASKNPDIVRAMVKMATSRLAAPTLEMLGATALYEMEGDYFQEVREEYQKRRDCIYEELAKIEGVQASKSAGAFYTVAALPVEDAEDFCRWLLEDFDLEGESLMMAPAAGFYEHSQDYKNQVRIAFILNTQDLKRAMHILDEGLKAYKAR